jgi:hypothetical protein
MGAHAQGGRGVVDLDAQGPAGKQRAPEVERRMDGAGQSFGAERETGIARGNAEGLGKTAVIAGTGLAGTDAGMKRLDGGRSHLAFSVGGSVALIRHFAKVFFPNRSDQGDAIP